MTTVTDHDWVIGLDARMSSLETEFRAFRDEIRTHYATKTDLADLKAELKADIRSQLLSQTRWMIGGLITTAGIVVALQRLWQ